MDPNKSLAMIRRYIVELDRTDPDAPNYSSIAEELAVFMAGLDEWLCMGGFLPRDWNKRR